MPRLILLEAGSPLAVDYSAIIQGVVAAVFIIGVAILYFDRMSKVSNHLQDLSDSVSDGFSNVNNSVSDIREEISQVDLKDMEKAIIKLDHSINNQNEGGHYSEAGTVYHELEGCNNEARVSFISVEENLELEYAESPVYEDTKKDVWETATLVNIEFENQLRIDQLKHDLDSDEEIYNAEADLFEEQVRVAIDSPYDLELTFPTDDFDKITEFIVILLRRIEAHLRKIQQQTTEFDSKLKVRLNND